MSYVEFPLQVHWCRRLRDGTPVRDTESPDIVDAMNDVELREVTRETVRRVCALTVAPNQTTFVAPNAVSIAEAHYSPTAWFRAIYAGDAPVGFVMLSDDVAKSEYFLWRLMIADGEQGKGYGRRAIELLVDEVRTRPGAAELKTSYVPGEDGPEGFYRRLGFEPTGEMDEGEAVARLKL